MTIEVHIQFTADDGKIYEADCEVTYKTDKESVLYIDGFFFDDISSSDMSGNTELLSEIPSEHISQAEDEAEKRAGERLL